MTNNEDKQIDKYQAERAVVIKQLSMLEKQYTNELRIKRNNLCDESSCFDSGVNLKHCDTLKILRDDCKTKLEELVRKYPYTIYQENILNNQEDDLKQKQLAKAEAVQNIYSDIADQLRKFIETLINECVQVLGKPPCGYAFIGLGSLAREEATPYSDFEFATLITEENEDNKDYFRDLTHLLHLKVINLGETILPSVGIPALNNYHSSKAENNWFYDNITPRGFAFDGSMPQACKTPVGKKDKEGNIIYELIHTPKKMAEYQHRKENHPEKRDWFQEEQQLCNILLLPTFICVQEELFIDYENEVNNILDNIQEDSISLRKSRGLKLRLIMDSKVLCNKQLN